VRLRWRRCGGRTCRAGAGALPRSSPAASAGQPACGSSRARDRGPRRLVGVRRRSGDARPRRSGQPRSRRRRRAQRRLSSPCRTARRAGPTGRRPRGMSGVLRPSRLRFAYWDSRSLTITHGSSHGNRPGSVDSRRCRLVFGGAGDRTIAAPRDTSSVLALLHPSVASVLPRPMQTGPGRMSG
jgi:hypothetical protein